MSAVLSAACGTDEPLAPSNAETGRTSSSIALLARTTGEVAVVNPDQGSVSFLDPDTLALNASVEVGGEPHALLELQSGVVLVSTYRGGEVVAIDPAARAVTARRSVCSGAYGLAEVPDGTSVAVACEWEDQLLSIDSTTLESSPLAADLSRPRAVAALGDSIYVAGFTGGKLIRVAPDGDTAKTSLVPAAAPERPALTSMRANLAAAILPAFGRVWVAHELVNNDGNTSGEKVADDYGSVLDGNPKINPAVSGLRAGADRAISGSDPPVLYSVFDAGPRVFNAPVALASFGGRYLLVANESTANVAVLDTHASSSKTRAVGSYSTGSGPSGIAVDEARRVAYVDNRFDGSVSRLDLTSHFDASAPSYDPELTLVRSLPPRFSPAALVGRKLFHDASNKHVTPSGVVACSTCHPNGGDDGLIWFVHTDKIPLKRRRTPHLANAHTGTEPFHFDGQFATMNDLVRGTLHDLMAGDTLLVDIDSVKAYIDEIVLPPVAPARDASAVSRGRTLFESKAGCATCHAGPNFTDKSFHAALDPMSLTSDDVLTEADTPSLHGLFARAPYFHDGRATDLRDLLTRSDAKNHGTASQLAAGELDDLIAYLESL